MTIAILGATIVLRATAMPTKKASRRRNNWHGSWARTTLIGEDGVLTRVGCQIARDGGSVRDLRDRRNQGCETEWVVCWNGDILPGVNSVNLLEES